MNFFGHAALAFQVGSGPLFALGAMLPDLIAMAGTEMPVVTDAELAAGIACHHASDRAFHAHTAVMGRMRQVGNSLQSAGLPRGPALGAAHVGVEMALDGRLAGSAPAVDLYLSALATAHPALDHLQLSFADADQASRWARVCQRLLEHGSPIDFRSPPVVAHRVGRALERRPRLRVAPHHQPAMTAVFAQLVVDIEPEVAPIMASLRTSIASEETVP